MHEHCHFGKSRVVVSRIRLSTGIRAVAVQTMVEPKQNNVESNFREDLRFRVLRLLQDDPAMSNREIARRLGVSVGGAHYCLKALADKGMIKVQNFRASDKKLHYAYVVTPKGISEKAMLAGRFLQRKMAEYETLKAEIEAISEEMRDSDADVPGGLA